MDYSKYVGITANEIQPSGIRKFFDIAAEMHDCLSLGIGEPDFITPASFMAGGIQRVIREGHTQYTSNSGLKELRVAISKYLKGFIDTDYNPDNEILVTVGSSEGLDLALRAILNPGDEVLVPFPAYVSYAPCVSLAGGVPVAIDTKAENQFRLMPEELEAAITPRTKALIIAFPSNPTGAIMEKADLEAIAKVILKHEILVISDEIYGELTYGGHHYSIAQVPDMRKLTVILSGFSKAFAMTGWRVGYIAAPEELLAVMRKIHQYVIMCAPTISQHVALSALEQSFAQDFSEVKEMRRQYNERRIYLVDRLNAMGLTCFEPRGAFYAFPCVAATGMDGDEFAEKLLREEKVAVIPGSAFGESGKNFVRISYAYSIEKIKEALDRIENFIKKLN